MTSPPGAVFRVLTFVTDLDQYEQMRDSFVGSGFDETRCSFELCDNTAGNRGDPYSVVNDLLDRMTEDYLVVCHQDVRVDRGAGYQELVDRLAEASPTGREWAVAGPAGIDLDYEQVLCVSDPWQLPRTPGPWPVPVQALDELLLVVKPATARLSAGLSGFHFYGADLCASARRGGWEALAIDWPVSHLSDGERGRRSADYRASRNALQAALSRYYRLALLVTSTGEGVLLSRHARIRRLLDRGRVRGWLKRPAARRVAGCVRSGGLAP